MLTPLQDHALLLFWLQMLVLFTAARGLGLLAQRIGQPAVVGELTAGILVGPSLLGRLFPEVALWLFPGDPLSSGVLLSVAWVGVVLLLIETGIETDLDLLVRIGRSTAFVPVGSLLLPLAFGIGMGFVMPPQFLTGGSRTIFALFLGICLAVSSLPVVAKILIEMNLMRRNIGQVILVAGMADDIVGWVMLSTLAGAASSGQVQPVRLGLIVLAIGGFIGFAFTVGQSATNALLRRSLRASDGMVLPMTALMGIVFTFAALTQAIRIEAVFGAFVAGIVIGRSRFLRPELEEAIHAFSHGVFAPIFFATAGMFMDLWQLANPTGLLWAAIVIVVASVGKLAGSYVGARGPLGHREAIAVGIGLNARGALEVIIATIALSLGVFNQQTYTVILLLALSTSIAAPPFLRWALSRVEISGDEAARLEREAFLASSVIAKARNALLPTRGGANSALAARVLGLALQSDAHVTVLSVVTSDDQDAASRRARVEPVLQALDSDRAEFRIETNDQPVQAILREASLGYDLVALGLNEDFRGSHELSATLQALLANSPSPVLMVRRGTDLDPDDGFAELDLRRILVPVTGTLAGRGAEEVAYTLGGRLDIHVDAVHVVKRRDRRRGGQAEPSARRQLDRARDLSQRMGGGASLVLRTRTTAHEEIVRAADEHDSDLIVLGAELRSHEDRPFLGHGTEYVLEHARQTVIVMVFTDNHVG
ncbi:MAG TPA: cation:proton antiporter [Nitriliruptorales bacterium]|nr:cation:proton antiporter [Nitriliruptorales bacterium]